MKKKKDKIIRYLVIIIGFVLLIALAVKYIPTQESFVGFSLLSLGQVNLVSSSQYLSGQQWVLTFNGNGLGQYAQGYIDNANIKSGTSTAKQDFKLNMEYDQFCKYSLQQSTAKKVYLVGQKQKWIAITCEQSKAIELCGADSFYGREDIFSQCTCYPRNYVTRTMGYAEYQGVKSNIKVTMDVQGKETSVGQFSSEGQGYGPVGSNAYVVFQGGLDSGRACPILELPTEIMPTYVNSQNQWQLKDRNLYTDWVNNAIDLQLGSQFDESVIDAKVIIHNQKANNFLVSSKTFGTINSPSALSGAWIDKSVSSPVSYPVITAYIKATYLEIYTPVPIITIVSKSSECFETGFTGYVKLDIKNTGESGGYQAWVECPTVTGIREEGSISSGQTKTLNIELSGSTSQTQMTETCKLKVSSIGGVVESTVNVCVKSPDPACTIPGETRCQNNKVITCTNGDWVTTKDCGTGKCIIKDGKAICEGGIQTCGDGFCTGTETLENCPTDCKETKCAWYQTSVTTTECNWLCKYFGFLGFKPSTETICVTNWVLIIGIIIGILVILFLLSAPPRQQQYQPRYNGGRR